MIRYSADVCVVKAAGMLGWFLRKGKATVMLGLNIDEAVRQKGVGRCTVDLALLGISTRSVVQPLVEDYTIPGVYGIVSSLIGGRIHFDLRMPMFLDAASRVIVPDPKKTACCVHCACVNRVQGKLGSTPDFCISGMIELDRSLAPKRLNLEFSRERPAWKVICEGVVTEMIPEVIAGIPDSDGYISVSET